MQHVKSVPARQIKSGLKAIYTFNNQIDTQNYWYNATRLRPAALAAYIASSAN